MKKPVVFLLHFAYWFLYLFLVSFIIFASFPRKPDFTYEIYTNILLFSPATVLFFVPSVIGFYLYHSFVFNRYFQRKKMLAVVISGLVVSIVASLLSTCLTVIIWSFDLLNGWQAIIAEFILMFILATIHGVIGLIIKGFITAYGDIVLKEELNKKNFEMELALMKAQINPHFLFNTINNIDVLILKDQKKASEYLNKLSDIMRFMLYEIKSEQIPFTKELTYIEKYIELQSIRTSNSDYIKFNVSGSPENIFIEPLLFIPFIENAFKHSENKKIENAISINMVIAKKEIVFECENVYGTNGTGKPEYGGLGNELIRRRLDLLYPEKNVYEISDNGSVYKVKLLLSL